VISLEDNVGAADINMKKETGSGEMMMVSGTVTFMFRRPG
jgi:hypothetical protein